LHRGIKDRFEEIVPEIVVPFYDGGRAATRLSIDEKRRDGPKNISPIQRNRLLELRAAGPKTHFIERSAIPPAVHVGFPDPEATVEKHSAKEPLVVNADIPGTRSVDLDVRGRKQITDNISRAEKKTPTANCRFAVEPLRFGIS
jgi:hypothetical protein